MVLVPALVLARCAIASAQGGVSAPARVACVDPRFCASIDQAAARYAADVDAGRTVDVGERRGDVRFQIVVGAYLTAAGTDIALSMYHIGKGDLREAGFGGAWQNNPVAFAATKSALAALFAFQLQRLHRSHPKAAFVLGVVDTAIEASLVARTAHLAK
jgi:hypothetical protein